MAFTPINRNSFVKLPDGLEVEIGGVVYRLSPHNNSYGFALYVYKDSYTCIGSGSFDHLHQTVEIETANDVGTVTNGDYADWMKLDVDQQVQQLARDIVARYTV